MDQPSLDFTTVTRLRDRAMQQVGQHAEDYEPGFGSRAADLILRLLESGPMSGEDLSLACKQAGIMAHDDRAYGVPIMKLARRGLIEKCGTVRRKRGHGTSGGNVWKLAK